MDANRRLIRVSSFSFFKEKANYMKTVGLSEVTKNFWLITRNELPARMLSTIIVFSIIQGFNHLMGNRPVSHFLSSGHNSDPDGFRPVR